MTLELFEKNAQDLLEIVSLPMDDNDVDVVLELEDPEGNEETLAFTLPEIPGAEDDSEILLEDDNNDLEVKEPEENVEVATPDPWDWQSKGLGSFLNWLKEMLNSVPQHSGHDTGGLERAISYFEALDREITKAMRTDFKSEIDAAKAEEARAAIEDGLDRMLARLEKLKANKFKRHKKKSKKAWYEYEESMVKTAQKSTPIQGIVISVPLFISRLARICINGMVSSGKDIEDTFHMLSKKYALTKREQAELMQLILDTGYPILRDRGLDIDEDFDARSSNNPEFPANYPS